MEKALPNDSGLIFELKFEAKATEVAMPTAKVVIVGIRPCNIISAGFL